MNATTTAEAAVLDLEPIERTAQPLTVQQAGALAAQPHTSLMLSLMDRGASLDQIERMMDLAERNEKREAEKAYNAGRL